MGNSRYESAVFIYNPDKLLHIDDRHLTKDEFNEIICNLMNSEELNNFDVIYVYTKMKERITPIINGVSFLDKIEFDVSIIKSLDRIRIYYIRNDEEIEKYLKEIVKDKSSNVYNKCKINVIDISENNKIFLHAPEWLKSDYDTSKDINANVKFFEQDIYEINNDFYLYSERSKLDEIKKMVHIGKPFFVIGERGSGKTTIIQNAVKAFLQPQKKDNDNFVSVACGTLLPDRAQSDLFGHKKGAYTGAIENTKGYVGKADGGCLYLDEVQDLSKDIQRMLVKGIEEHKFYQVGSDKPYESNFLLVCSSNKHLSEIREYMYEDFYDRISVFQIKIPSIEERKKDADFISKCLPGVWKNYRKKSSNSDQFCEYDQLDDFNLDSPELPIKEKIINALKNLSLKGNFRDIEKLLAYIELYALNNEIILIKGEISNKEKNDNIDMAIREWEAFINERNSYLTDSIPPTLTDDFLKKQKWKELNKMFKSWVAEQAVRIYGSVNAAAQKLGVDKNVIRNNLPDEK